MGLADQYAEWDALGMPRPVQQQAAPPPRQRKPRRQKAKDQSRAAIANRLWSKLAPGTAAAGSGIVPYAAIPESIRQQANLGYPVTGWDPKTLEPDERALLTQMLSMNKREVPEPTAEDIARHERRVASQERAAEVQAANYRPWRG